jgi:hypothetical protein
LVDVDSTIPNLALMKVSSFYKGEGAEVGFDVEDPDLVILSVIYRKNREKALALAQEFEGIPVDIGGTGFDLKKTLPDAIEYCFPDYDLYPSTYSQGFSTRGCIRNCAFCIVQEKEGPLRRNQHPSEFHDDRFDTIWFMDNNWIADKEWFMHTSEWVLDMGLGVMECGFDIRLLDDDIIGRIAEMKFPKGIHFAFDDSAMKETVKAQCQRMKEFGINIRKDVIFYVYCDSPQKVTDAVRRCNILKRIGTNPFVMYNIDRERTPRVKRMQHWANRRRFFWSCTFDEFSWKKHYALSQGAGE